MDENEAPKAITDDLIAAFLRLAKADFTVRLPRNFRRDTEDLLALFVNQIAEELGRLLAERDASRIALEAGVAALSEAFLRLAAGDFSARAARSDKGDPLDVLAYLLNNTAAEIGEIVGDARSKHALLQTTLESMVDGVVVIDEAGVVRQTNTSFCRMLRRERDDLLGHRFGELLAPSAQQTTSLLLEAVQHGDVHAREVLFRTASGEVLPLSVNASAQRDAMSSILLGLVLVARDERELKQAHAQLQLRDRLATMGTLAAGVAHEINNPLSYVAGNVDFVIEELESLQETAPSPVLEEVLRALAAAKGGASRVRQIVRDLKAFSRVDEDEISQVDLGKLLDTAAQMVRNEVRHRATLSKNYEASPLVRANEPRLLQVFLNLIQNAAQAIPTGHADEHHIRLATGTTPDGWAFATVEDTGSGIPEKDHARIFEAFFSTKAVGVGTGLGLSIAQKIVGSFGGRLEVSSEVGRGSTFRVVLPPVVEGADASRAKVLDGNGEGRPSRARTSRKRVLVIDDEVEVGRSIERILAKDHEVVVTTAGKEGLALLAEHTWDIVLCDLMMPDVTGVEVYQRVVERAPDLAARFVFLSGGTFDDAIRAFLLGVPNGLLEKPIDTQDLRSLVAQS